LSDWGLSLIWEYEGILDTQYANLYDYVDTDSEEQSKLNLVLKSLKKETAKAVFSFKEMIDKEENSKLLSYYWGMEIETHSEFMGNLRKLSGLLALYFVKRSMF
jgi:hypothetical protein